MRMVTMEDFQGFVFKDINSPLDVLADVSFVTLHISEEEMKKMAATNSCNFMKAHYKAALKPSVSVVPVLKTTQEEKQKEVLAINNNKGIAEQSRHRRHCDYDNGVDKFLMMNNNINYSTTSTCKRSRNPDSLADQEDDGGDTDWEEVMKIKKKKKKKKNSKPTVDGNKKMRKTKFVRPEPEECPDLPERFRQRIEELNGRDITLVIQKPLFNTDLSRGHDRLSIPLAQIITWDNFLTPDEKALLSGKKTIALPIIDPKLDQDSKLIMVQWDMKKKSGKTSPQYALRSKWYKVVEDNQLKQGQVLQVWSFRVKNSLHIALVVIRTDVEPLQGILPSSSDATAGASSSSVGGCGSTD